MILSYLSHKKMKINDVGLTILSTTSTIAYRDLVLGFQCKNNMILCSDDSYTSLEVNKAFDFIGDILLSGDVTQKYMNMIMKKYISSLDEVNRDKIMKAFYTLETTINDSLLLEELPLEIDFCEDLKKMLKLTNLHLDHDLMKTPYAIIETVLRIHQECKIDSIPVICNVANYLNNTQLKELSELVKQLKLKVILIEFTDKNFNEILEKAECAYIDQDLIDWY